MWWAPASEGLKPASTCVDASAGDISCDDGLLCNGLGMYCDFGTCEVNLETFVPCDDFEECTMDMCDEPADPFGVPTCTHTDLPDTAMCGGGSSVRPGTQKKWPNTASDWGNWAGR